MLKIDIGDIVTVKNLYFSDNTKDEKINRPLLFLFSFNFKNREYALICPISSQIKTFNKHHENYFFLPEAIYNYKKLSFVNTKEFICVKYDKLINTNIKINQKYIPLILNKLKKHLTFKKWHEYFLYYGILFNELEVNKKKKNTHNFKKEYRRQQKSQN